MFCFFLGRYLEFRNHGKFNLLITANLFPKVATPFTIFHAIPLRSVSEYHFLVRLGYLCVYLIIIFLVKVKWYSSALFISPVVTEVELLTGYFWHHTGCDKIAVVILCLFKRFLLLFVSFWF